MVMESILGEYRAHNPNAIIAPGLSSNRMINAVANRMNVGCAE